MKTADDISAQPVSSSSSPSSSSSNNNIVPLRTVLQNFLNLVESYESQRSCGIDAYEKEFQELKIFSENLKSDPDYQCKEGEKSVSRKKNRYKDILPFDYTRVTLTSTDDVPGSDYINANFIKGASGSSAYIACQGPLAHTVNDFWKMVVECEVQVIVMACMEQESGKHKCEKYWVEEDDIEKQFGDVTVWLKKCRNVCPDFLVRTMRIKYTNARKEKEERNVCQFHYSAWPDHGIPNRVSPLLDMVRLIRDCQTSETLPVLVHCSAGCGRTGTICAIDYVWGLLRLGKLTADFSLFQLVKDMRRQRIAMVQTKDQYILVHRAVKELFQEQLKIIDAHIYANLDPHGFPFRQHKQDISLDEPTYETIEFDNNFRAQRNGLTTELSRRDSITKNSIEAVTSMLSSVPKVTTSASQGSGSVRLKRHEAAMNAKLGRGNFDDSVRLNGLEDEDEICAVEDNSLKAEPTTSNSSKSGLLRKPSIIKLKQFFERSPKEGKEKKASIQLSRAKSDVSSSRFYAFTSSFGSKRSNSPNPGITTSKSKDNLTSSPTSTTIDSSDSSHTKRDKVKTGPNGKPPLCAKPVLPIKRSKSLKVNMESSNPAPIASGIPNSEYTKSARTDDLNIDRLSASGSPTGGFSSHVSHSPIKVTMRQVETPKSQSIISSSVKPQSYTATQSTEESMPSTLDTPPRKPSPPSVVDVRKLSPNYVNIGYGGNNKLKIGTAKEMEDLKKPSNGSSSKNNKAGRKKYDTVNSRSFANLSSSEQNGTTLTRSQSHVWEHEKLKLTDRIFSDENLSTSRQNELFTMNTSQSPRVMALDETTHLNPRVMKVRPILVGRDSVPSVYSNSSLSNTAVPDKQGSEALIEPSQNTNGNPVARERAPRAINPYSNLSLGNNGRYSPLSKNYDEGVTGFASQRLKDARSNIIPTSITNSSESSNSNTGTPRNSLPSTPSQSIDGLYSQHVKSNSAFKLQSGLPQSIHSANMGINPKPILKGSLSSSSESDDRMDSSKLMLSTARASPLYSSVNVNPVALTTTPKMSSGRTPLGIRERRNSFRQAVWKEAQNDGQQYHSSSNHNPIPQITQSQTYPLSHSSSNSSTYTAPTYNLASAERAPVRSRRDYEPIWPEDRPMHVSSTYVNKEPNYESPSNFNGIRTNYNASDGLQFRPTFTETSSQTRVPNFNDTHFQHKLDEIKILLEGLNTPPPSTSTNLSNSNLGSKSNNLKYHRSLKSPSKSQYMQQNPEGGGLSCFSFKKTNSFESISDQFELADGERQPLVQDKSPFTFFSDAQQRNNNAVSQPNSLFGRTRTENYSLGTREDNVDGEAMQWSDSNEIIPIPPPRTKAKRNMSLGSEFGDNGAGQRHEMGRTNLSLWAGGNGGNDRSSASSRQPQSNNMNLNKTAISSGSNEYGQLQQQSISNGNIPDNSPKPLSRAFGAFQAKAASVRSKFANWTEPKDKTHGFKSMPNGELNLADENGGFTSSVYPSASPVVLKSAASASSGQVRTTKHQYL